MDAEIGGATSKWTTLLNAETNAERRAAEEAGFVDGVADESELAGRVAVAKHQAKQRMNNFQNRMRRKTRGWSRRRRVALNDLVKEDRLPDIPFVNVDALKEVWQQGSGGWWVAACVM